MCSSSKMSKYKVNNSKIFYRIFPSSEQWEHVKIANDKNLHVRQLQEISRNSVANDKKMYWKFETDGVFYNTPQSEISESATEGVLESCMEGHNAIIVAFGQTGSGKSLTIGGLQYAYPDRGIMPRVIEKLFALKKATPPNFEVTFRMSYIEVFNINKATDLLQPYPNFLDAFNLKRVTKELLTSEYEGMELLYTAEGRKEFGSNKNYPSHIATSILTFEITKRNMDLTDPYKTISYVHVIDMAGSDIIGNSTSVNKNHLEIGCANLGKSQLEQFILVLIKNDNEEIHIKKRLNIMIQYLGKALSTSSILRFIGHIRTNKEDLVLTLSMLRFGQIVKGVKPHGDLVEYQENEEIKMKLLEQELNDLKKERLVDEMLRNEPMGINPDRQAQIQKAVQDFVDNKNDVITLVTVTDITTTLNLFKQKLQTCEQDKLDALKIATEKSAADERKAKMANISGERDSVTSIKSKTLSKKSAKSSDIQITQGSKLTKSLPPAKRTKSKSLDSKVSDITTKGRVVKKSSQSSINQGPSKNRSSIVKRKSHLDTTSERPESKQRLPTPTPNAHLPEVLPEHREALIEFMASSEGSNARILLEAIKKHDKEARNVLPGYTQEVEELNNLMEMLEVRKNELLQATLVRKLTTKANTPSGAPSKSQFEAMCESVLRQAQQDVTNQQEIVLKLQSEFTMLLHLKNRLKDEIKQEFEKYCIEKYSIPIPNLEVDIHYEATSNELIPEETIIPIEETEEQPPMPSEVVLSEKEVNDLESYESLKKLIVQEVKKKELYKKKNTNWVHLYKNSPINV